MRYLVVSTHECCLCLKHAVGAKTLPLTCKTKIEEAGVFELLEFLIRGAYNPDVRRYKASLDVYTPIQGRNNSSRCFYFEDLVESQVASHQLHTITMVHVRAAPTRMCIK